MEYVPDQCFDLVIDKGTPNFRLFDSSSNDQICLGLFDAIMCSENNLQDIELLLREMYRILKTGGAYLVISHAPPEKRIIHFEKHLTGVEIQALTIGK